MKKYLYVALAALSFGHSTLSQAYTKVVLDNDDKQFLGELIGQANQQAQEDLGETYKAPTFLNDWSYHVSLHYAVGDRTFNKRVATLRQNLSNLTFKIVGLQKVGMDNSSIAITVKALFPTEKYENEMAWKEIKSLFSGNLHITVAKLNGNNRNNFNAFYDTLQNLIGGYKDSIIYPWDIINK